LKYVGFETIFFILSLLLLLNREGLKMVQVVEIKTKRQFYKMQNRWNKILNKSQDNNIFLTWEKMAPSVNNLEKSTTLKILCAIEGKKLLGIAPFRKSRRSLKGRFTYNVIEPLTNGNTDYAGIILAGQEKQCLSKILEYLFSQGDWDLFYLPDLPQPSLGLKLIKDLHESLPRFNIEPGWICPYLPIPDSKEKLIANINPKFRKELKRRLRKLEKEHGKVELKPYYELGSIEETMEILFKLHKKRWGSKGQHGSFANPKARNMALETAKFFAKKDWLRLYFLTVNDTPVAAELDLEYENKLHGHLCGFDPNYSKYGVGNLLMLKVLEECVNKGIYEYDFMQGAESYKFDWTSKYRQSMNVRFANKKISSKLISSILKILNKSDFCKQRIFPTFQRLIRNETYFFLNR